MSVNCLHVNVCKLLKPSLADDNGEAEHGYRTEKKQFNPILVNELHYRLSSIFTNCNEKEVQRDFEDIRKLYSKQR